MARLSLAPVADISRSWRLLRHRLDVSPLWLVGISALSVGVGISEAAVLGLVVYVAAIMSGGAPAPNVGLGPIDLSDHSVGTLLIVAGVLALIRLSLQILAAYAPARLCADAHARLRSRIVRAYTLASWDVQSRHRDGELLEILSSQVYRATTVVVILASGVAALFTFVTLGAAAIVVNPLGAGITLLAVGVLFVVLRPMSKVTRARSTALLRASLDYVAEAQATMALAEETRVFGVGEQRLALLDELNEMHRRPFFRNQVAGRVVPIAYQGVTIVLLVAGLGVLWAIGSPRLASLGAMVLILVRSLAYGQGVQASYHSVQELLPTIEAVDKVIAHFEGARRPAGNRTFDDGGVGPISFDHVTFGYDPERPVLRDLSFAVEPAEAVGIVGPSGAGKSTVAQLLLGLRSPQAGVVRFGGIDVRDLADGELALHVAYVPQDTKLLNGTVADNIRFLRPDISDDAVREAAVAAHIHDDIMAMPKGYDTVVSQRADALSGGQRQRLCLARALAGHPDVLVLDEPTSALDMQSERLVQESLRGLLGRVTLFVVAHRLSTLQLCGRIMVLENGALEAFAPADELLRSSAFFRLASTLTGPIGQVPS